SAVDLSDDVFGLSLTGTLPAPFITNQPVDQTVVAGEDVTFNTTAFGAAPLDFQWMQDGMDLFGETGPTLRILAVQPLNQGIYQVRVSNGYGVMWSDPAQLTVMPD